MKCKGKHAVAWAAALLVALNCLWGENIDPNDDGSQYAYGQNVGWLNLEPSAGPAIDVNDRDLTGYIWAENIGWINLAPDFDGVRNDGTGKLSGFAWGQNVGWINFAPAHGGVVIDSEGNFDGWAWGQNIGWIHMRSRSVPTYKVQTSWLTDCIVDFSDVEALAAHWLAAGRTSLAGYWPFDEGYGVSASDLGAGGNSLSLIGDTGWGGGKIGNFSLDLDGASDYARSVDDAAGLDFAPGSFTASAWINGRQVTGGWRTILEYDRAGNNWFGLWLSSEGRFHFRVGLDKRYSVGLLEPDRWYLVTGTYEQMTKELKLYIDAEYDSSTTHEGGLYNAPKASKLTVGVCGTEDAEYFDGRIDEIRIYSRLLAENEIRGLLWGFGADFNAGGIVDFHDYVALAGLWLDTCPPGWPLY